MLKLDKVKHIDNNALAICKVLKSFSETQHETEVKGSGNKVYRCYIDMEHPRKSKCNCPLADG
nr:hypothetical protein [Staphylococcus aureus]